MRVYLIAAEYDVSKLSRLVELGPVHGPLAALSHLTGSSKIEVALLKAAGRRHVRSRYNVELTSNWSDSTFNMCYLGQYGRTLANLLGSANQPFVFLDIGANQGLYSLIAGKNPACICALAFEPVPKTYALLQQNIAANRLRDKVTPVNSAISSETGSATITVNPTHSGGASMAGSNGVAGQPLTIAMTDHAGLDALIPDGDEQIYVKIDVEGFEPIVVEQLTRSRHIDRITMIFYEVDEAWIDPAAIEAALRSRGFSRFEAIKGFSATHYDVLATR